MVSEGRMKQHGAQQRSSGASTGGSAAPAERAPSPHAADPAALRALAAIHAFNPDADPLAVLPDVHPARLPRHIAIIMDGNGRWAVKRGFPRVIGHRAGAGSVRSTVEECVRLGIEVVTLYSFSLENWKRPKDEVEALMQLCIAYLAGEEQELLRNDIRFKVIGRREGLPAEVVAAIDRVERVTSGGKRATLCLAINYGSRAEIADATRDIARKAARGEIDPETVDETVLGDHLYTAGLPDPDLLIRTAGELRLSNYLLWQISYAELFVSDVFWPDFTPEHLHQALRAFAARSRRFGAVQEGTLDA